MIRLRGAEKAFLVEDDHNYYLDISAPGYLRLAIKHAGYFLKQSGLIGTDEDVYFLYYDEIIQLLKNGEGNAKEEIEKRKCLYRQRALLSVPSTIGGRDRIQTTPDTDRGFSTPILNGHSGSSGVVEGIVLILSNCFQNISISEPCILVIPHGHGKYVVPFLDKINGIIFDTSSPYDHVGILAREFGIPTLYNTKDASKKLKDGDRIRLICSENRVEILNTDA